MKNPLLDRMSETELEGLRERASVNPNLYRVSVEDIERTLFEKRNRAVPPAGFSSVPADAPEGTPVLCWRTNPDDPTLGDFFVAVCRAKGRRKPVRTWSLCVGAEYDDSDLAYGNGPTHWRAI